MAPPVTSSPPYLPHDEAANPGPAILTTRRARPHLHEIALLASSLTFAVNAGLTYRTTSPTYGAVTAATAILAYRLWHRAG